MRRAAALPLDRRNSAARSAARHDLVVLADGRESAVQLSSVVLEA
jgi:hypothetical protein